MSRGIYPFFVPSYIVYIVHPHIFKKGLPHAAPSNNNSPKRGFLRFGLFPTSPSYARAQFTGVYPASVTASINT